MNQIKDEPCNLCGNPITDRENGGFILPFGNICHECVQDIKEFGTSRIQTETPLGASIREADTDEVSKREGKKWN